MDKKDGGGFRFVNKRTIKTAHSLKFSGKYSKNKGVCEQNSRIRAIFPKDFFLPVQAPLSCRHLPCPRPPSTL
jgi:hypothetical protein